ncbi:hypothetical protein AB0F46_42495 [Streptomyces sp. NPDC026665]|uniref:hypothetical protein n=1 Tax=Streptomyces sp. NPDC026665 TaxID=3154798 RepID=UPI0033FEF4B5
MEFRNDAVALFRAAGGRRTYAAVAADVGVTGQTLRGCVRQANEQDGRARGGEVAEGRDEELARLRAELGWLRRPKRNANRSGRSCGGRFSICAGDEGMTGRWDFISTHRADFGVQRICRVLGVSRSGY